MTNQSAKICLRRVLRKLLPKRNRQLRMILNLNSTTSDQAIPLPDSYIIQSYENYFNAGWIEFLNQNKEEFGIWDYSILNKKLLQNIIQEGSFLIFWKEMIVGCAVLCNYKQDLPAKTVSYVLVDSKHRGRKLGKILIQRLLEFSIKNNFTQLILRTDDTRKAAIKLYLTCGFKPHFRSSIEKKRWIHALVSIIVDEKN